MDHRYRSGNDTAIDRQARAANDQIVALTRPISTSVGTSLVIGFTETRNPRTVMAIKKSDLYSSLWQSCDELRGGMDASQYKDYVLFMLFIKYNTDKYANSTNFKPPATIPRDASFVDMLELRGTSDIGDRINMQVIAPLVQANTRLAHSDFPDFNDPNKLG